MKQIEELKIDEYQNDGNFVLNECIDWFNKYLETYDSFRKIQEKSEDLQIITTISKEQIEIEKSKYLFSIDLMNTTTGQPVLEGTRISMDSKNGKASKFLMAAITTSYLSLNQDLHLQSLEDGIRLENKEAHNSVLNVSATEEDTLWLAFLDIMGNMNNPEVLEQKLSVAREEALQEQGKIDDEFCESVDKSDQCYLAVKRYLYLHKRK